MESPHKHSYLQSITQNIPPQVLNRAVNLARDQPTTDTSDLESPFHRLTSEQPHIPTQHVELSKRPEAFGRWALPKLRNELHNPDPKIVLEAVCSLYDIVHDSERAYEAIRLRIPDRLADLLVHEKPIIRERVCMTLTTISGLSDGRGAIVKNKLSLKNLEKLMNDSYEAIRNRTAILIESISRSWFAADYLVEAGFIKNILEILLKEEEPIQLVYLDALVTLMYGAGKDEALSLGAFDTFITLMETKNNEIASKAADCLMMITSTYSGKDIAYDNQILPRLTKLLHHENSGLYSSVASAIMFCTIKSRAKIRAKEIPRLVERLILLSNDWHNRSAQIFSIKALTNICEHPEVREEVKSKHLNKIEEIVVGYDEDLSRYKGILLSIIKWLPWESL